MDELALRIADLELEIDVLRSGLLATTSPDAQWWSTICLTACLRERSTLMEQFRLAALACLDEPLRERSVGQTTEPHPRP